MKKISIALLAFAAAVLAVSCQKEDLKGQNEFTPMTISAVTEGIETQQAKAEMAYKYEVLWQAEDKIYVTDGTSDDTFTLSAGAGTTKGTFKQDGSIAFTGEVQAYYPQSLVDGNKLVWPAVQTNNQAVPMCCKKMLSGTADEQMNFSSLGSVLQIVFNTTQADVTLKSIEIKDGEKTMSGAFAVDADGKAVVTATDKAGIILDLGKGKVLGKAANYFNIAIPAGAYQDLTLVFTATDGTVCKMTGGKVDILHNTVGRLTLAGETFKEDLPEGALKGLFSVSPTKKVHFSQGNLTYNVSTRIWAFYEHQYDCATGYDSNLISLFTWGYNARESIDPRSHDNDNVSRTSGNLAQKEDWGCKIGDGNTWRTLSEDEWVYLLNTRSMPDDKPRYSKGVTIEGIACKGIFLYPDNYDGAEVSRSSMTWAEIDAAGIVFLPAAGHRQIDRVKEVGTAGHYWSSSALDGSNANNVDFQGIYFQPGDNNEDFDRYIVSPDADSFRESGLSVRLITDSKLIN